jgi:hypothetical protein
MAARRERIRRLTSQRARSRPVSSLPDYMGHQETRRPSSRRDGFTSVGGSVAQWVTARSPRSAAILAKARENRAPSRLVPAMQGSRAVEVLQDLANCWPLCASDRSPLKASPDPAFKAISITPTWATLSTRSRATRLTMSLYTKVGVAASS